MWLKKTKERTLGKRETKKETNDARHNDKFANSHTFSMSETSIFEKHGKLETNGFRVIRGAAKTCKSTT